MYVYIYTFGPLEDLVFERASQYAREVRHRTKLL